VTDAPPLTPPSPGDFYDQGSLQKVAINLFYGWGYNFYRLENQLRADDQLIRRKASELLGQANAILSQAESDYRRHQRATHPIQTPLQSPPPSPSRAFRAKSMA